jgi:nitrogenase subunit NifH
MYDINIETTEFIESFCRQNHVEVVGAIPFDSKVTQAMVEGKTIIEYAPSSAVAQEIETIYSSISAHLHL